jgi:hypothetical protein
MINKNPKSLPNLLDRVDYDRWWVFYLKATLSCPAYACEYKLMAGLYTINWVLLFHQ